MSQEGTAPGGAARRPGGFPLDHVGIAVRSIEEARSMYERLTGAPGSTVVELPDQEVNVAFFGQVELLEPRGSDSPVGRFLARSGSGIHHVALRVPDLAAELRALEAEGYELVDRSPRLGAHGLPIAFLHPRTAGGVLLELVEGPAANG